jgi:hypothetical protein
VVKGGDGVNKDVGVDMEGSLLIAGGGEEEGT